MTMDMNMQHRGGLRVQTAVLVPNKTASPATSDSSDRTGSPANNSPSASPSLLLPLNNNNNNNNNNHSEINKQALVTSSTTITSSGSVGSTKNSIKRSFDVAFLMAPDDLSTIKKRHQQQEQQLRLVTMMRSAMTPLNVSVTPPQPAEPVQQQQQAISRHILQQHPPSLMIGSDVSSLYRDAGDVDPCRSSPEDAGSLAVRSAFTKVTTTPSSSVSHHGSLLIMQNASPSSMSSSLSAGGLSPEHTTYQNSLSPSPRAASTPTPTPTPSSPSYPLAYQPPPQHPAHGLPYGASPFYVPQHQQHQQRTTPPPQQQHDKDRGGKPARRYSPPAISRNNGTTPSHPFPFGSYPKATGGPELMAGFQKLRPGAPPGMLYPDSLAAYTNLAAAAAAAYPFGAAAGFGAHQSSTPPSAPVPVPVPVPSPGSALAAAAVVSASLLPPTLAALSLPAQNVCAKCNVSFRMTSDLVYHMRAHHKSDHAVNDPSRRRREQDKLKCPVCSESFRERHHLTRHMTAHQDKEGDMAEEAEPQEGPPAESRAAQPQPAPAPAPGPGSGPAVPRRRGATPAK